MRTLFGNHARFEEVYFSRFQGYYATGDGKRPLMDWHKMSSKLNFIILSQLTIIMWIFTGARRDEDGYLWVTGRVDDMLNVSGHLMSTAEVESVLAEHPGVAEAAVVSRPHKVKGQCLYCFITPQTSQAFDSTFISQLKTRGRLCLFSPVIITDYGNNHRLGHCTDYKRSRGLRCSFGRQAYPLLPTAWKLAFRVCLEQE